MISSMCTRTLFARHRRENVVQGMSQDILSFDLVDMIRRWGVVYQAMR